MSKLRKLIPLLMIAALVLVAVPVSAAILPIPALYRCTVYENDVLVGAGKTVEAFVGTETVARDSDETDASGVALLEFSVDEAELGAALRFEVDGNPATETPDVDVSIAGLAVRLDYTVGVVVPTVVTNAATNIGTTTARLNGSLTDMGTASTVTVYFKYGSTTAYGYTTDSVDMTSTGSFWADMSGLSPGTTYHFMAVAEGDGPTQYGDDMSFTTLEEPVPGVYPSFTDWLDWWTG